MKLKQPKKSFLFSIRKSTTGFTLIEFLIYIAIVSSLLTVISMLLYQLLGSQVKNQSISDVEQEGEQAMQIMTQTIRNADSVNNP